VTRVPKRKKEQSIRDFPWKVLAIVNTFLILFLAFFLAFYVLSPLEKSTDNLTDDFTEEELLAQGFEKLDEGFYGMVMGEDYDLDSYFNELGFNQTQTQIAKKIAAYEEFQGELPLQVIFIDKTTLAHFQETRGSFYTTDLLNTYEILFPSYIVFYDHEEEKILDWFYFQTVNILE